MKSKKFKVIIINLIVFGLLFIYNRIFESSDYSLLDTLKDFIPVLIANLITPSILKIIYKKY
jgi:hypothetical protein